MDGGAGQRSVICNSLGELWLQVVVGGTVINRGRSSWRQHCWGVGSGIGLTDGVSYLVGHRGCIAYEVLSWGEADYSGSGI